MLVTTIQFAVLLPSEGLARAGAPIEPDDIWTLGIRAMLLFLVCQRTREDRSLTAAERAQHAVQTWLEVDDIERRLRRHTCDLDSAFGFQAQETLFA